MEATIKTLATRDDINNASTGLRKQLSDNKVEIIRWMFFFWIAQVGALLAIVLLV